MTGQPVRASCMERTFAHFLAQLALVSGRRVRATALRGSCLLCALLALAPTTVATQEPDAPHPTRAGLVRDAACAHLPPAPVAAALPNDNREPAGTLRSSVLSLRLSAREVAWYPEGPRGCALPVHALAEERASASIPGPLIRVTVVPIRVRER
jgi:hypothetical protein